jgi:hypothetical protein
MPHDVYVKLKKYVKSAESDKNNNEQNISPYEIFKEKVRFKAVVEEEEKVQTARKAYQDRFTRPDKPHFPLIPEQSEEKKQVTLDLDKELMKFYADCRRNALREKARLQRKPIKVKTEILSIPDRNRLGNLPVNFTDLKRYKRGNALVKKAID